MIQEILLPFQFPFMQNAFLICLIVSIPTALLSCFLVLKGWALMGDAISHAVLPGVVLAYIAGLPLLLGAFVAGMTCALATGYLSENSRVKQDTIMGIVFSGMFGLGIVLFTAIPTDAHLDHILFGNILGISAQDLWAAGTISVFVTGIILLRWKDLMVHAFDPIQAKVSGLRTGLLHNGLLTLLSLTIVSTLSATGLVLAIGLLIAPGAIAFLFTKTFSRMLWIACGTCLGAMMLGTYLSFVIDSAPAPTIILVLTALFIFAFVWRQRHNPASTTP